ncbi:FdhF/YdeP family oxidoreductase [Zhongshania aliphaticivorans]|uniref:FdhF/YdeP family oxidoreductase n=1 Tax=Zhongshania aliphaticivorans TaxID=1470434 RepID=UPI0012E53348|nr:FdhF/YdeP family oxidoreductase [Zhongshania aliphaticivorans]CAA0083597.1 putative oxidoreductase [Zhongshania aliphaticivorans]
MKVIGGGPKKVLYTLNTARKIGLLNSAKALNAKNACKACGLGMGGQRGGMTNELDEFPSVCNKSIQAQSTDIQAPIPAAVFSHTLEEFRSLSARELETLGRLGQPVYKAAGENRYAVVDWDWAINHAAEGLAKVSPDRSFFYSSGRSSNEAGFLLQLMARLYGTNNISNCSYYCHQATGEALGNTVGTGTATVELDDIAHCDLFFLIGANPASNHPRLLHKLIGLRRRGGTVVVINPLREAGLVQFAAPKMISSIMKGGDEVASIYLQPKIGSDIALFTAIAKAVIEKEGTAQQFILEHASGYTEFECYVQAQSWQDLLDSCGIEKDDVQRVADVYIQSQNTIFAWGMGMTHHQHGVDNIEWISNLALMRGMVGKVNAGLLPLRGHSNVQGIGTIGVKPVLPSEVFSRIEQTFGVKLPKGKGMHTLESLEWAYDGGIDAALIMGGNLYEASPDSKWAAKALDNIGLKIFLTTTLNRGHVTGVDVGESLIFPVCARDEEPEPTTQESMFNYVRLSDGGIERIASVRSEVAILADIASKLVLDCPINFTEFKRHQKVRQAIAKVVPGMEELADIDVAKQEFYVSGRLKHQPEFNTPDGRARFVIPLSAGTVGESMRPYTMMTIRSEGQFNSIIYEESDSYRGVNNRWTVLLNQQDALELGVSEGATVDICSDYGEMRGVEVKLFNLPKGCVAAYYPEANVLSSRRTDPRSHTPQFKSIAVSLSSVNVARH